MICFGYKLTATSIPLENTENISKLGKIIDLISGKCQEHPEFLTTKRVLKPSGRGLHSKDINVSLEDL